METQTTQTKSLPFNGFFKYCETLDCATLVVKIDIQKGQPTQLDIIEVHQRWREPLRSNKDKSEIK